MSVNGAAAEAADVRNPGRVVVCGNVVFDILARPVDEIRWAATTVIEQVEQQLGGNAGTTSCTIGTLGVPVSLITLAGRDASAEAVFARLVSAGVNLDLVQYVNAPTSIAISLVRTDGERALLYLLGAASEEFAPFQLPTAATHFHLAAVYRMKHLRSIAPRLLRQARDAGLRTSLDTQWDTQGEWRPVLEPTLPFTDYTLLNEDEARMLTGHSDPASAARSLRDAGATNIIIKLGPRGCWANGTLVPGYAVSAVDTTGAGDCFSGGFVAALERGLDIIDAARFANAVGALAVQKVGAAAGVRSWDETVAWAATTDEPASTT
jgi:sugar/nucleoside kinase (ribokinase family)